MTRTTLLRKRSEMKREPLRAYGGSGMLDWTRMLGREHTEGAALAYLDDDVLAPGVSVGVHPHGDDEEYYVILSGRGVMTLDGEPVEVGPGDVAAVFPGGSHGLQNTGSEPMRILVVCVRRTG